jgi:hypothetical protein
MIKNFEVDLTDQNLISRTSCPICSNESKVIDTTFTINPKSKKKSDLRECLSCYHWWNDPLPSQELLNTLYQEGSEYVVPKNYKETTERNAVNNVDPLWQKVYKTSSKYSDKISSNKKDFNYLEIGVGSGQLLNFFKQKALITYGVEPGNWVVGEKKNIVKSLEEVPSEINFDMMVAHGVLEHLNDPGNTLTALFSRANENCVIHCTFPNKDALKARLQKGKWHMVRPFGHLHYFSKQSVTTLFEKAGWTVVELINCRISEESALDLAKKFDLSKKWILYRLVKSLLLGQILLGKDQWTVVAVRKNNQ